MSTPEDHIAFWTTLAELQNERDAALADRANDPERWQKAKYAYAEFRTAMRTFSRGESGVSVTVVAQPAEVSAVASNPEGA